MFPFPSPSGRLADSAEVWRFFANNDDGHADGAGGGVDGDDVDRGMLSNRTSPIAPRATAMRRNAFVQEAPPAVDGYFWRGAPIDERQRAYCRCQLHVAARNKPECYEDRGAALGRGRCYNPYAVCTASVGRQSECSAYYAFTPVAVRGGIPDDEVDAYARLRGLPVGTTREATVATIYDYLISRRK